MKKILLVNDFLQGGGVEKLMYDLTWAWHDKYQITIMTIMKDDAFEELYPSNVKYIYETKPEVIKNKYVRKIYNKTIGKAYTARLMRNLSSNNYDYAIAIKEGRQMKLVDEAVNAGKKYCWNHTDYNSHYYTNAMYGSQENERQCMARFDKIVCVSEDIATGIKDVIGDPGNLIVKYNPVNVQNILEMAKEPVVDIDSMELPSTARPVRFVTVGRINHQKGFDILIEAAHMLELEGYKFEVIIVGGDEPWGEELFRLKLRIKRLGVTSVKMIGGRNNAYKYMAIADWFLSSSIFEGYSLVSQEAAVLDVPLLLTRCSGVRELIGDDEYGLTMEPSVIGIYEGMKKVLDDPSLHDYYKEKIMERKSIVSYEDHLAQIEKLFD